MSVLTCSRENCEHIMCDLYSPTYGYICSYCFDELVAKGVDTNIEEFMNSEKSPTKPEGINPHDYFMNIFNEDR